MTARFIGNGFGVVITCNEGSFEGGEACTARHTTANIVRSVNVTAAAQAGWVRASIASKVYDFCPAHTERPKAAAIVRAAEKAARAQAKAQRALDKLDRAKAKAERAAARRERKVQRDQAAEDKRGTRDARKLERERKKAARSEQPHPEVSNDERREAPPPP